MSILLKAILGVMTRIFGYYYFFAPAQLFGIIARERGNHTIPAYSIKYSHGGRCFSGKLFSDLS